MTYGDADRLVILLLELGRVGETRKVYEEICRDPVGEGASEDIFMSKCMSAGYL